MSINCKCCPDSYECELFPPFVRLTEEQRKAAWVGVPVTTVQETVNPKIGQYPKHWLDDPGTHAMIASMDSPQQVQDEPKKLTRMSPPREGSRKHQVWAEWVKNPDEALALGKTLELKETTLRSWFAFWDGHEFTEE